MLRRGTLIVLLLSTACLDDWKLEEQTFKCEKPSDCVSGYYCEPTSLTCQRLGEDASIDAGPDDAGNDAGVIGPAIGEPCGPGGACGEGACVDGFCCESFCDGVCEACDRVPGFCVPIPDGQDPEDECGDLDCESFTCGVDANGACRACGPGQSTGVCNGERACRPDNCLNTGGLLLSECVNLGCIGDTACPAGDPIAAWDDASELCEAGKTCPGTQFEGCCAPNGACCPTPECSEADPLCE